MRQGDQPIIQRKLGADRIQSGRIVVIFLRLNVGAALDGLLYQLLEVEPFSARISELRYRLPLPAAAELVGINLAAGELTGQRELAGEVYRIIKRFQNRADLDVVELRLERGMRRCAPRVERAGERESSTVQAPLHLMNRQQPLLVADVTFHLGKVHPPPLQLVSRQVQPGVKTAQSVVILLNIVIRNNRAQLPVLALPLLVNAIIARGGGMRKQAIEVERARLKVQRPVRLVAQHDAAVAGNGAAVSR